LIRSRWAALALIAAGTLLLGNCSGSSTSLNPTPFISQLFPPQITAGSQLFTLSISGTGLISTTQAFWNGSPRTSSLNVNTGQLVVSILAGDVANPSVAQVTVTNPAPGGGESPAAPFQINALAPGAPTISPGNPFTPASANAGTRGPFLLTVNGTGFVVGSVIRWNGEFRITTFMSQNAVTTNLTSDDLALKGSGSVSVDNPTADGGFVSSVSIDFPIN
jgi:hypothetical protein